MAYLSRFDPPLLDGINGTLRGQFQLGLMLQGLQPPTNKAVSRLFSAFLIVVDKAIREYDAGCAKVKENLTSGGIRPYIEGVGHFETCVNSVKRAMRLLERIASAPDGIPIDRFVRRSITAREKELTDVRDAVEHIDKDILNDQAIEEGMAHLLTVSDDGERLEIGANSIPIRALHSTISALHAVGSAMIQSLPSAVDQ